MNIYKDNELLHKLIILPLVLDEKKRKNFKEIFEIFKKIKLDCHSVSSKNTENKLYFKT